MPRMSSNNFGKTVIAAFVAHREERTFAGDAEPLGHAFPCGSSNGSSQALSAQLPPAFHDPGYHHGHLAEYDGFHQKSRRTQGRRLHFIHGFAEAGAQNDRNAG